MRLLFKLIKDLYKQTSRGDRFAIDYIKATRSNLTNYLSGNPVRNSLSRCTKDGIPVILGNLIPIIRSEPYVILPMVYSILFSTRPLKLGNSPDTASITMP